MEKKETKPPLILAPEEIKIFLRQSENNPELLELMRKKGIEFDTGDIEIEVNGERLWLDTTRGDFGTLTYAYQHNERPEAVRRRVDLRAVTKKIGGKIFTELDEAEEGFKRVKK